MERQGKADGGEWMEAAARKTWKRKMAAVVQMSFKTSGRGGRRCQRNFNLKLS